MTETTNQTRKPAGIAAEPGRLSDPDDWLRIVDCFEDTWQSEVPPRIEAFLPHASTGDSQRSWDLAALLQELVKIDIEYRWRRRHELPGVSGRPERAASGPRIEEYAALYPQLGTCDALWLELIGEEYRVRQQWGDRPGIAEFLGRFPRQALNLGKLFCQIDHELTAEDGEIRWPAVMRAAPAQDSPAVSLPQAPYAPRIDRAIDITAEPLAGDPTLIPRGWTIAAGRAGFWQHMVLWARRRRVAAALLVIASIALTGLAAGAVVVNARLRADAEQIDQVQRASENVSRHTAKAP
jgi:hypothetical protein